ncbi:hypothetical protein PFISCL1PPCAC_20488 [Pristionchus fissidentatus]|uniref:Uncharacterized protein n=1 Tax=Pristionchus fissidentatus TaxID=1538716 RepID=A0AAV5WAB3_9BILA|nr:hypothetical protein PFISCL1PPCAC_20488 [Pristionchus fissidentatus]
MELVMRMRGEDFILHPSVLSLLTAYLEAGGDTVEAIEALAGGYTAKPQICNTLSNWLRDLGCKEEAVECLEGTVQAQILRHFDADKADAIFQADPSSADWLKGFVQHHRWRRVIYELLERSPSSLFLAFAMKLIADAGHAHEISGKNTATQQIDVFARVFVTELELTLEVMMRGQKATEDELKESIQSLASMMMQNEQSFIYATAMLEKIVRDSDDKACTVAVAVVEGVRECLRGGPREQEAVTLRAAMKMSPDTEVPQYVRSSILTMICKRNITAGDLNNVYQSYILPRPPPVALIREKILLRLLMDSVFSKDQKQTESFKQQAVFLLAYAATVYEKKKNDKKTYCNLALESARSSLERAVTCLEGTLDEVHREIPELLHLTKHPIVAAGCLWYYRSVLLSEGTRLGEIPTFVHVIFDHCGARHKNLHATCLEILDEIYDKVAHEEDQAEVIMARQRVLIDRLVYLLTCGAAVRVLQKMTKKFEDGAIDASLIRYFVLEVLDVIGPPYSLTLLRLLVPLVTNLNIIDEIQRAKLSGVGVFLEDAQPVLDAADDEEEDE